MKTALITGASRGIGYQIAIKLAQKGYNIVINYNQSKENAQQLEKLLKDNNFTAISIKADVSDENQVKDMIEKAVEKFGSIDVLVNNAGISQYKMFLDTTFEDFSEIVDVNLKGVYNTMRQVLPYMCQKKTGKIVNIASIWGEVGASCESLYSMTKAGVIGLTKSLAKEFGPSNININAVAPGFITTDMTKNVNINTLQDLLKSIPMGKVGEPRNVADVVAFLCSDSSSYITGEVINVNGGWVI